MSAGRIVPARDEEGYLVEPDEWTPEIAAELARAEGLELCAAHWLAIDFVREYHAERGIIPDVRHVVRHLARELGLDKKGGMGRLFELFPYGYVAQTCKIAGMRRPRAWSTG